MVTLRLRWLVAAPRFNGPMQRGELGGSCPKVVHDSCVVGLLLAEWAIIIAG